MFSHSSLLFSLLAHMSFVHFHACSDMRCEGHCACLTKFLESHCSFQKEVSKSLANFSNCNFQAKICYLSLELFFPVNVLCFLPIKSCSLFGDSRLATNEISKRFFRCSHFHKTNGKQQRTIREEP